MKQKSIKIEMKKKQKKTAVKLKCIQLKLPKSRHKYDSSCN